MPENIYTLLALGTRYWFTFLGLMIVFSAFRWLMRDRRAKHKRLQQLPDAGTIGEFVVLQGQEGLPEGATIPIPWEGTLGSLRTTDVVIPAPCVAEKHGDFSFQNGKGLFVAPRRHQSLTIDNHEIHSYKEAQLYPMQHGSVLSIGDAMLRLRVFAGFSVERAATLMEDVPPVQEQPSDRLPDSYMPSSPEPLSSTFYEPPVDVAPRQDVWTEPTFYEVPSSADATQRQVERFRRRRRHDR